MRKKTLQNNIGNTLCFANKRNRRQEINITLQNNGVSVFVYHHKAKKQVECVDLQKH